MEKIFEVYGDAIGKQRPKGTSRGGFVRMYTPKKTIVYENLVSDAYLRKYTIDDMIQKPNGVSAKIIVLKKIPKSYAKKKTAAILNGGVCLISKPDVDNVAKSVLDALNGVAYEDDTQVCNLHIEKHYTDLESKVTVFLEEID